MKKLAVIILNWNGLSLLKRFLPTAVKFTMDDMTDLIVADNGSTDGSLEWLQTNFPALEIISFRHNHGFAAGYNKAIEQTRYQFTVLLNSDVEVTENWTRPLLDFMENHPEAGAVQPKIKSLNSRNCFEYAGAAGGYLDRFGYPYCRGRLFDSIEEDRGQYDGKPVEIAWASGAALMVRTNLYLELGGLDPVFFAHMEEIDLCCRMQGAGYKIFAVTDSEVYHLGGGSLQQGNPKKTYLNFRNNLLLLHKNFPREKGKNKLLIRRLIDSLAFFMFLAKLDFPNAKALLKAHSDFRKMKDLYVSFPQNDYMKNLPGAKRLALVERFIFRKKKILP